MALIDTPDGQMREASYGRRIVSGLIDYAAVILTIGLIDNGATPVFGRYDWFPILRVVIWASGLLGYLLYSRLVWNRRGPGDWLLRIRRYRFSQLRGYAGKGTVACVEN
jgi:hypothetical protein